MIAEPQKTVRPTQTRNLFTGLVCVAVLALAIVAYGPGAFAAVGGAPGTDLTAGVPGNFSAGLFAFEAPVTYQARLTQQGTSGAAAERRTAGNSADQVVVVDGWSPTFYFWQLSPP